MAVEIYKTYTISKEMRGFEPLDCQKYSRFIVTILCDGTARVIPEKYDSFEKFVNTLWGCLQKESNFQEFIDLDYRDEGEVTEFEFTWDGYDYIINSSTDINKLCKEFTCNHAKILKLECRRQRVHKKILDIDAFYDIKFKDFKSKMLWKELVANAEDIEELKAVAFARRYAKTLQYLVQQNGIENMYLMSASVCDAIDKDGIVETSIMQFTFDILKEIWVYGDDF